jgi:hypothetical protein
MLRRRLPSRLERSRDGLQHLSAIGGRQKTPDQVHSEASRRNSLRPQGGQAGPRPVRPPSRQLPRCSGTGARGAPIVQEPVVCTKEKNTTARSGVANCCRHGGIQEKLAGEGDDYCFPPLPCCIKDREKTIEAGSELRNNSRVWLRHSPASRGPTAEIGSRSSCHPYEFFWTSFKLRKITNCWLTT